MVERCTVCSLFYTYTSLIFLNMKHLQVPFRDAILLTLSLTAYICSKNQFVLLEDLLVQV
jgi:hypothetical protein